MRSGRIPYNPVVNIRFRKAAHFFLLLLPLLVTASCNFDSPGNLSAEQLHTMLASGKPVLVVDTRSVEEYREGHIPGAILISQEKAGIADRYLPAQKDLAIVFYCRGGG